MPHKASSAQRLLVLTLMIEAAVQNNDWREVKSLLNTRAELIDDLQSLPKEVAREIGIAEERILTTLRKRLVGVRGDLRNLTAALRIAAPYARAQKPASLSLAS